MVKTTYLIKIIPVALFCVAICFFSCKSKNDASATSKAEVSEDFKIFYDKFHKDSLYQIAHIRFPLQGLPTNVDSLTAASGNFYWQANEWQMQHEFDTEKEGFLREFKQISPNMVIEAIKQKSGPYGLIRRFYRQDGEWYLIYYMDMNKLE